MNQTHPPHPPQFQENPTVHKRHASERGKAEHGWLHARFTFSFSGYFDPDHMGFRSLRVMNNDVIEPGGGFPMHPHTDAEIFTYVISGAIQHKDNQGNGAIVTAGDLQYMSAGSGIMHSEFNPSKEEQTELYQIWLRPNQSGGSPIYSEKQLGDAAPDNSLTLLFSGTPKADATIIRQDAEIYFGKVDAGKGLEIPGSQELQHTWIQILHGEASAYSENLTTGDGLAIQDSTAPFLLQATQDTSFLLFKLS